jgi:hypothetical protein
LRQTHSEVDTLYTEKKRNYDMELFGINSSLLTLDEQIKSFLQDIKNDSAQYHNLNCLINITEIGLEKGYRN